MLAAVGLNKKSLILRRRRIRDFRSNGRDYSTNNCRLNIEVVTDAPSVTCANVHSGWAGYTLVTPVEVFHWRFCGFQVAEFEPFVSAGSMNRATRVAALSAEYVCAEGTPLAVAG